ncbi:hypothetical protein DRO55_03750, partial [Candidatus Bathyarchaeota archaeon]
VFKVLLSSIANPNIQEDTNVWFIEYYGCNSYELQLDRAPDTGSFFISHEVISELPYPTQLILITATIATIYIIYKRRFREAR